MRDRITVLCFTVWVSLPAVFCCMGCEAIPGSQEFVKRSMIKPSTGDYDDGTDDAEETWIRNAGVEARGDRPLEHDSDPFRNLIMSPKARSIERNLGFD